MSKNAADKPAFPTQHVATGSTIPGMTLRDWFAGLAMQGIFANSWIQERTAKEALEHANGNTTKAGAMFVSMNSRMAVEAADALIAELEKRK